MGLEIESIRYAHGPGHTDICYGSDNRNIFTCGSDGYVRIWDEPNDDDSCSDFVADQALSVACTRDRYLVATNNNYVQGYNYANRRRDKIVFRFSAPVTHLAVSCSNKFIAACSCDMEIQVMESKTNQITTLSGHAAPVLSISLDPLDEYLVSSSCDGTVKVWELSSGSVVKNINNVVPTKNDFFKALVLARCAWKSTSGLFLAVPEGMEVCVYKRNTWAEVYRLSSKNIEKDLSAVLFSPCGNYVAAASIIGEIIIWETKHKSQVCCYKDNKKIGISGIVWHPDGSKILFCDRLGRLGVLTGISEEISKHSAPLGDGVKTSNDENIDTNSVSDEDDEDDRDENCISLEKIKSAYKNLSDDYNDNDDGDINEQRDCESPVGSTETCVLKGSTEFLPKSQSAFQPSSTPFNFEPRCLCYNEIGMVRYYNSDKTIDIQFHDAMFHHSLFLRSFGLCTMASLSSRVLCLAVPSIDDNLSKLTCISLGSWAGNKEWTVQMPVDENILAVAASGSWVAVATSSNYLRIFSHAGTQKQVLALPGAIVCMTGYNQKLLIVYNVGLGSVGNQNLGFTIYQISNIHVQTIVPFQPVPLSPNSTLAWLGFSDEGTPCTYDSKGILRLLGHDLSHWSVICDTKNQRKSTSDNYFLVGLSETNQNIRCILCRNSHYPLVINNPTVLELPLKIPLCEMNNEKSISEEAFWRLMFSFKTMKKISLDDKELFKSFELPMNQAVLKLFGDAINNSEDLRAVDLASLMTKKMLDIAVQYSNNKGKTYLVEKLKVLNPVDWSCCYQLAESVPSSNYTLKYAKKNNLNDEVDNNTVINSQQDLFEDSEAVVGKENKPSCSQTFESTSTCFSVTSKNPFKKTITQAKEDVRGLKFFDTLSKIPPKQSKPININKSLKINNSLKEKDIEVKPKKATFMEWFSKRRNSLSEEYPNLSSSDLTKLGMKIYKEEMKNIESNSECFGNKGNILNEVKEPVVTEKSSKKHSSEEINESDAKRFKSMDDSL